MKKLIGSLIVISLLVQPNIAFAKSFDTIRVPIMIRVDSFSNIEGLMQRVSNNTKKIGELLGKKNELSKLISTKMQSLASTNASLSEEQMTHYQNYYQTLESKDKDLMALLAALNGKVTLKGTTYELLSTDTDYVRVNQELKELCDIQQASIALLSQLTDDGYNLLENL